MGFHNEVGPIKCRELLQAFKERDPGRTGEKLTFYHVGGKDVYNITAPFEVDCRRVIAGRVESRDSEYSKVMFFEYDGQGWSPIDGAQSFDLQDPFVARIHGEIVLGGVEVWPKDDEPNSLLWRTVFYRGANIYDLKPFAKGPVGMKDIRLVTLSDGTIGVFTRPQGDIGGRGKIGYTTIASLDDLNEEVIEKAPLIDNQFDPEEWGGVNEAHLLSNGMLGVLGHIACFDEMGDRHYYSMAFMFDPVQKRPSPLKIIAVRSNFKEGAYKRKDLTDVIFSGGIIRRDDGYAELYCGVSDAEAHWIVIPDPFLEYEDM